MPAKVTDGGAHQREFERLLAEIERCYHVQARLPASDVRPHPVNGNGHADASEADLWGDYQELPPRQGMVGDIREAAQALYRCSRHSLGLAWVDCVRRAKVAWRHTVRMYFCRTFKWIDLLALLGLGVVLAWGWL